MRGLSKWTGASLDTDPMSCSQDAEKVRQQRSRIAQRLTVRQKVRLASSLAAALLDGHFAHPAWPFRTVSHLDVCGGHTHQHKFFRSLLGYRQS